MRRDKVEEAVEWCIENPNLSSLLVPIPFDLTPEEHDLLIDRLKEESDKLTEWPEIGIEE